MTIMSIGEEQVECPLCMEPLEMDDINFFPCTCGYQICRFCWHRIRTDENGLCPACRKAYPEDPAEFKPLTEDELQRIKKERKLKDLQRRQRAAENRKHLANVRVVQKNLVFAVGLSQRLGDVEMLKKHDYFGKFGKIVKVVINQTTSYAGAQVGGPSASAYITYQKPEDALRAIQAVNNIHVDGRTLKASLGTTKYCSHFLKGTQCPKPDCMYLHELGEESASFTKDEMQQGKHQEYEQKLYETYMNHLNSVNLSNTETKHTHNTKSRKKTSSPNTTVPTTISPPLPTQQNTTQHSKDAWPSLTSGQSSSDKSSDRDTESTRADTSKACPSSSHSPSPSSTPTPTPTHAPTPSHTSTHIPTVCPQKPPSLLDMPVQRPPGLSTNSIHRTSNDKVLNRHVGHSYNTDSAVPPLLSSQTQLPAGLAHSQQLLGSQRKNLFGDAGDNMSLFGLSGFTRKPPVAPAQPLAADSASLPAVTMSTQDTISDSISVTTPTDWSAAFGFKSAAPAQNVTAHSHQLSAHTTHVHTPSDTTDDDLGFDPWNESTKALQDLIQKESTQPNRQTDSGGDALTNQLNPHLALHEQRTKALPPGFAPSQVNTAFPHAPLVGGSRMMGLMKLPDGHPLQSAPPSGDGLCANAPGVDGHGEGEPFMKDWQQELRALLPNINISFGSNPQQQSHLQQAQQSTASQANKNWDLTWDPAVVTTGSVANNEQNGEEPHWMASLHHLTEEPINQPVTHHHKLLSFGLRPAAAVPGFVSPAVPTPPPGFQHPVRTPSHPLVTDPHPLSDTFQ